MFEEYKNSIESHLINLDYLYSGDVVSSQEKSILVKTQSLNCSTEVISKTLGEIYEYSIKNLISKPNEIVIDSRDFTDINDLYLKLGFYPTSIIFSKKSNYSLLNGNLHLVSNTSQFPPKYYLIPDYFQMKYTTLGMGHVVKCYYSPIIDDSEDDCHIYFINGGIQSFVWILQNMSYNINRGFSSNEHLIRFPIYDCDFQSTRIRVVDAQKIREKKISQILS